MFKNIKQKLNLRSLAVSNIGSILENYDISLYGFSLPILISVLLPHYDRVSALLLASSAVQVSNIISRPIGAFFIGRIGDSLGRKSALTFSMLGMAIATTLIGCIPGYEAIGIAAPILYLILRSAQSFCMAGEVMNAGIFALEHHDKKHAGFVSGMYCAVMNLGAFIAALSCAFFAGYWRVPYLLGAMTGVFAIYARMKANETPEFTKYKATQRSAGSFSVAQACRALIYAASFNIFYLVPNQLAISLIPLINKQITTQDIAAVNSGTTALYIACLVLFGLISDRVGITRLMRLSSIVMAVLAWPMLHILCSGSLWSAALAKCTFAVITAAFSSPFQAHMQTVFSVENRCRSLSLTYAIGAQLGAILMPLTLWSWRAFASINLCVVILIVVAVLGAASLKARPKD